MNEPNQNHQPPARSREKAIWAAAIVLAHNICVQASNRINAEDGPLSAVHALSDEAKRIAGWMEPTEEQLRELFAEAGVPDGYCGQWMPIETAPTTGETILLWDGEAQVTGYYGGAGTGIWRTSDSIFSTRPTHWMALPPPPVNKPVDLMA